MKIEGKIWKAKSRNRYANQNGSKEIKKSLHVQRLDSEHSYREYNLSTSLRFPDIKSGK